MSGDKPVSDEVARRRARAALQAERSPVSRSLTLDEIDLQLIEAGFGWVVLEVHE
jgi:hypothetical protein